MPFQDARRIACVALLATGVLVSVADLYAGNRVTVRVYGDRPWDDAAFRTAVRTASIIIRETGVETEWLDCRGGAPLPPSCRTAREPHDLMVRLTSSGIDAASVASREAERDGEGDSRYVLGVAVIDRLTQRGALATVYLEHVRIVASRVGIDRASLLGRVIAHEVGHLLHGKAGHGRTGLMRQVWTGEELGLDRPGDWRFVVPEERPLGADLGAGR